jgi:hypothetical protein
MHAQQKQYAAAMALYQKAYLLAEDIADTHLKILFWCAIGALDGD